MNNKFTPGPWKLKLNPYQDGELIVQAGAPTNRVVVSFGSQADPIDQSDYDNARLIAAAPEMYEALEYFADLDDGDVCCDDARSVIERARAAIKKAREE